MGKVFTFTSLSIDQNHSAFGSYGFKKSKAGKHCGGGQTDLIIFTKVSFPLWGPTPPLTPSTAALVPGLALHSRPTRKPFESTHLPHPSSPALPQATILSSGRQNSFLPPSHLLQPILHLQPE